MNCALTNPAVLKIKAHLFCLYCRFSIELISKRQEKIKHSQILWVFWTFCFSWKLHRSIYGDIKSWRSILERIRILVNEKNCFFPRENYLFRFVYVITWNPHVCDWQEKEIPPDQRIPNLHFYFMFSILFSFDSLCFSTNNSEEEEEEEEKLERKRWRERSTMTRVLSLLNCTFNSNTKYTQICNVRIKNSTETNKYYIFTFQVKTSQKSTDY